MLLSLLSSLSPSQCIIRILTQDLEEQESPSDKELKSALLMINILLTIKVKRIQTEVDKVQAQVDEFIKKSEMAVTVEEKQTTEKKKRKRKKKNEVERIYKCLVEKCLKSYGSENSLNQHMKLKHNVFWMKIKEKEHNLNKVNTYKTPVEVFQRRKESVLGYSHAEDRDKFKEGSTKPSSTKMSKTDSEQGQQTRGRRRRRPEVVSDDVEKGSLHKIR